MSVSGKMTSIRLDAETREMIALLKEFHGANMSEVIRKSIKVLAVLAAAKERGAEVHIIGDGIDKIIEVI